MFSNGIDASTGTFLPSADTPEEFAERIAEPRPRSALRRRLSWLVERPDFGNPERGVVYPADPRDLSSAGWGVVFAPDISPDVVDKLRPLLDFRKQEAGSLYKEFFYRPGQDRFTFLAEQKVPEGVADPRFVPYYLLLVGSPCSIPFSFQCELDVEYAVGRISFDTVQGYDNYVKGVLAEGPEAGPGATFFGVNTDSTMERTIEELVEPLSNRVAEERPEIPLNRWIGKEAGKTRLAQVLGGEGTTRFLAAASHGVRFPSGHPSQLSEQGALLYENPPPEAREEALRRHYFAASDIPGQAALRGMIAFLLACYSAGTPEVSSFREASLSTPPRIAPHPFVSSLPQRLLGHPRGGALAVLGHVDRMWTTSFSWSAKGQSQIYESVVLQILDGLRIGSATEAMNQRYAALGVEFSELAQARANLRGFDAERFSRVWRAYNDAKNFVLFGDPAVQLAAL